MHAPVHAQTHTHNTYAHTGVYVCGGEVQFGAYMGGLAVYAHVWDCAGVRVLARAAGTYGNIRDGAPTARTSGMMHAFLEEYRDP